MKKKENMKKSFHVCSQTGRENKVHQTYRIVVEESAQENIALEIWTM
jgi:hypothetical protein